MDCNLQSALIGVGSAILGSIITMFYSWYLNRGTIKVESFKFEYVRYISSQILLTDSNDERKSKTTSIGLKLDCTLRNTSKRLNKSIYNISIINKKGKIQSEYSIFDRNQSHRNHERKEIENQNFLPSQTQYLNLFAEIARDFDDFPTGKWYLKYRVGRKTKLIDLKNPENNINSKYS